MAGERGLKRADIRRLYFPIHNVKQRRTHHRKPGNDDAELHCRDANSIRVCFPRKLASNGREAMSLLPKTSLLPKEGGGAPNGAPRLPRLDAQARPRPNK